MAKKLDLLFLNIPRLHNMIAAEIAKVNICFIYLFILFSFFFQS